MSSVASDVQSQIDGNDYRLFLLRAIGGGLVALIALAQLGTGARLGSGGPTVLAPVSITALIVAALFLGITYGNTAYATAQLKARLRDKTLQAASPVPEDVKKRLGNGWLGLGVLALAIAVGFFLAGVWWPASHEHHQRHHHDHALIERGHEWISGHRSNDRGPADPH